MPHNGRLVYLDTSHLDLLARAREKDPEAFDGFRSVWRASQCVLVLTRVHLLETRRYGDSAARNARYELISALTPIVSDVAPDESNSSGPSSLVGREIFRAFMRLGMVGGTGAGVEGVIARWCSIFPGRFATSEEAAAFRVVEEGIFGWAARAAYSALTLGASAKTRGSTEKYDRRRLVDLPDTVPAPELLQVAEQQLLQALEDPKMWDEFAGSMSPAAIDELKRTAKAVCLKMLKRQGELGPRGAIMEHLRLEAASELPREPIDTLIRRSLFTSSVNELLDTVAPDTDGTDREKLIAAVQIEDCPGSWLRHQVEIQLHKATAAPRPGDEYDLEHIAYLPYVSVLFTDRRIAEFTDQVLRRVELLPSLQGISPPVRANSVDKIVQAIHAAELRELSITHQQPVDGESSA